MLRGAITVRKKIPVAPSRCFLTLIPAREGLEERGKKKQQQQNKQKEVCIKTRQLPAPTAQQRKEKASVCTAAPPVRVQMGV